MSLIGMGLSLCFPTWDGWMCAQDAKLICPAGSAVWMEKAQGGTSHHPEPHERTPETMNSPISLPAISAESAGTLNSLKSDEEEWVWGIFLEMHFLNLCLACFVKLIIMAMFYWRINMGCSPWGCRVWQDWVTTTYTFTFTANNILKWLKAKSFSSKFKKTRMPTLITLFKKY